MNLSRNNIGDEGARSFALSESLPYLQELYLGGNHITDEGALALSKSTTLSRKVIVLGVSFNRISEPVLQKIRSQFALLKKIYDVGQIH